MKKKKKGWKGSWHAVRGTRGSFSRRPGILHSLRLQEPQTRASIWASASRHLSLPFIPRVGSSPSSSRHHRSCFSLPISLSLISPLRLYSPTSRFHALRTLCSSLVSRFLFFSPKVDQTEAAARLSYALYRARILVGKPLMLDDDIRAINIRLFLKILKVSSCFDILPVHCFNIHVLKINIIFNNILIQYLGMKYNQVFIRTHLVDVSLCIYLKMIRQP